MHVHHCLCVTREDAVLPQDADPTYFNSNNDVTIMKAVKSRITRTDFPYTKRQGLYGINPNVPHAVIVILFS